MTERFRRRVAAVAAVGLATFLSGCAGSIGSGCNQADVDFNPQLLKLSAEVNTPLGSVIGETLVSSNAKYLRIYGLTGCRPGALQVYNPGPEIVDDGQGNVTISW